jgi:DNA ligase-1
MLHRGASFYRAGRSDDLLKFKRYEDAEARVVAHIPGHGKFDGLLGSLLVETPDGIRFKVGSGFSDKVRKNPPPVGSNVTYKYFGKTINGVPRFASFLRIRE